MIVSEAPYQEPSRRKHILLVEDNLLNQKLATLMLQRLGYDVDVANDGSHALDQLAGANYDLIIMDCVMPKMDGYQTSQRLRHIERLQNTSPTPIVAVTANSNNDEERARCIDAGMDDFLTKPLDMKDLQRMVEKWVHPQDSTQSEEQTEDNHQVITDTANIRESLGDQYVAMVNIYLADAKKLLAQLKQAVSHRKTSDIIYFSHTLAGSSRYVGAQPLAKLCSVIQISASDIEACEQLLAKMEPQLTRTQKSLLDSIQPD